MTQSITLDHLADHKRRVIAHQEPSGDRLRWVWYLPDHEPQVFQAMREDGHYESAQRRRKDGVFELVAWRVRRR